jgi:hypothetical protein
MKKETLEEAAEKYKSQFIFKEENKFAFEDFIEGAKWQQEQDLSMIQGYLSANLENIELLKRSYSEEDMKEAIMFGANGMYGWQMGEEGYTDNQIKRFLKTFKK